MNKFIKTSTASSGFEKYPKLLEMMEQNHQMKMTALRKQIEKLKADKSLTQVSHLLSFQQNATF